VLKILPYHDPMVVDYQEEQDPNSAVWHICRETHELTILVELEKEDDGIDAEIIWEEALSG
jgi:hypothetical protein